MLNKFLIRSERRDEIQNTNQRILLIIWKFSQRYQKSSHTKGYKFNLLSLYRNEILTLYIFVWHLFYFPFLMNFSDIINKSKQHWNPAKTISMFSTRSDNVFQKMIEPKYEKIRDKNMVSSEKTSIHVTYVRLR